MKAPALMFALLAAACTDEQIYNSSSEWRVQQCGKLPLQEQAACQENARTTYPEMKKSRDEAAKPKN